MKKRVNRLALLLAALLTLLFTVSCSPVDRNYGVESKPPETASQTESGAEPRKIMSSDRVMSKYLDISLFDEENYSSVYLGKRFRIKASFAGDDFTAPMKFSAMIKKGWKLADSEDWNEDSPVLACESVDVVFVREDGKKIAAVLYNSSNNSVKLKKCYVVKMRFENDFYANPKQYSDLNVNGLNNKMAITDIMDTLGTPSHFYGVSQESYYLDYFISENDRRNGISVYINPVEDTITAIEISYYK